MATATASAGPLAPTAEAAQAAPAAPVALADFNAVRTKLRPFLNGLAGYGVPIDEADPAPTAAKPAPAAEPDPLNKE